MIALGIAAYIVSAFIATVVIMVIDYDETQPSTEPYVYLIHGFIWPFLAVAGLFVGIGKLCQKVADQIIGWRDKE